MPFLCYCQKKLKHWHQDSFLRDEGKDLRRKYTLFKSSYDNFGGNSDDERYDSLSKNLDELASLGSKGKHIYITVMK